MFTDSSSAPQAPCVPSGALIPGSPGDQPSADRPTIDVLVVSYNSRRWLDGFLAGLVASDYPHNRLRLIVVDNASQDDGIAYLQERAKTLPFAVETIVNATNLGFAGGYQVAFAKASADYWFVVNQDTELVDSALTRLVAALEGDPTIGIAEARQAPREHPKYYDPFTRETSWCSGACMMLRREAAQQVGGFDPVFFMYAEDVDLSWRMWRHGWKCAYVPEAVVRHFTEDLDPGRDQTRQFFYSLRNGALMRVMYGTPGQAVGHLVSIALLALGFRTAHSRRWTAIRALASAAGALPHALTRRWQMRGLPQHPLIYFNGWDYGRHLRDLADDSPIEAAPLRPSDLVLMAPSDFCRAAQQESSQRKGLDVAAQADAPTRPVIQMCNSEFSVSAPASSAAVLHGQIGLSPRTAEGIFTIEVNAVPVFRAAVRPGETGESSWTPFSVRLPADTSSATRRITLRHMGPANAGGGWMDLRLAEAVAEASRPASEAAVSERDVSIVIPTFNRGSGLANVLRRLAAQDVPADRYEILVVDNNSTDATQQTLAEFRSHRNVRTFFCATRGAAAARNVGLDHARGRLVIMMDDDILVRRDFVSRLWRRHQQTPERILLTRIVHPFQGLVDPFLRYLQESNEVNAYHFADPENVPPEYFYTGCVAVPRAIVGEHRFDEQFKVYGVEDIDFGVAILRAGTRMTFTPEVEVWHDYYPGFAYFCRKKNHAGFSLGYYLEKRPSRRCHHVFEKKYTKRRWLVKLLVWGTRPLAKLLEWYEARRYRTGRVNRLLNRWYRYAIRLSMYEGMLTFNHTQGNAATLADLGHRGSNSALQGAALNHHKQAA